MSSFRYVVALLDLVTAPAGVLFWFVIHPFARAWRRLHPGLTYGVSGGVMIAVMVLLAWARRPLLRVEFGTSYFLLCLGIGCVACAVILARQRRRHLTFRILAGWPEVAPAGHSGTLLTEGIYARIRHPRYVEVLLGVSGYALIANYLAAYVIAVLFVPMIYVIVILEERELRERFGDAYTAYCRRVPRFFPRRPGWLRGPRALGTGWVLLTAAFAGHVVDEAENGFLEVYNPIARAVRARAPLVALPTFEFGTWLGGLVAVVAVLAILSSQAYRRRAWVRRFALVYAIVMIGNGLLHIVGSAWLGHLVPGLYSSPLLIAAGAYLLSAARHADVAPAGTRGGRRLDPDPAL